MKHSHLAIISGLLLFVILAISWCSRKPKPEYTGIPIPAQSPSPVVTGTPAASPSAPPSVAQVSATPTNQIPAPDFRKVTEQLSPAVILVSVFDEPGKLLRTGTGFFISDDGRFITNWHVIEGGAHAVAKTSDGGIYNVNGILAEAPTLDLAVLKAEAKKKVPFLVPSTTAGAEPGTRVAAIASPLARRKTALFEGTVSAKKSDQGGEWLELSARLPDESVGSPVVSERGEVLGVVAAQHTQATAVNVVRTSSTVHELAAKIESDTKARWHVARSSPSALPLETAEGPAARQTEKPRIVYNPKPAYPAYSYFHEKGNGRFRVIFSASGEVKDVEVIQSTHNETLDNVTLEALRRWKSTPGQEWSVTVPITFQSR